jgi:hypothetical protein
MPLNGFKCNVSGKNVKFLHCHNQCQNRCEPLPFLLAHASEGRVEKNRFSVTEIHNPAQVVFLKRNYDYYASPESFAWMMFGTAVHGLIESQKDKLKELGLEDDYLIERQASFTHNFDIGGEIITLSGRAYLFDKTDETLYDFKTRKFYYDILNECVEGKPIREEILWQLNIYNVYGKFRAKHLKVKSFVKDHNRKIEKQYGIPPIVTQDVPMLPECEVWAHTEEILTEHVETQRAGVARPCTAEERWYNPRNKEYVRCVDYCPVSDICPQWQEEQHEKIQSKAAY